jgi:cysteine desulfurase
VTGAVRVYLDHAATSPMRVEAVEAMLPFLSERYANPVGSHAAARDARRALDEAREVVAGVLGAAPGEVVFTSGGTESDNLAICGPDLGGGRAICSSIEHHAVLHTMRAVGGSTVPVDAGGILDLAALAAALAEPALPPVRLVSTMLVNNEVGTVQPLAEVVAMVRQQAPEALVHTDAVQALCWTDLASIAAGADLVSVSAHKFGGPKGVGALVVRPRARALLRPIHHGGGQERDLRSGTHNVAGIVAMSVAAAATLAEREEAVVRVSALRDRLADQVRAGAAGMTETTPRETRAAGICHLSFEGIEAEELLLLLDRAGVAASAGSACASGALEPSHVLSAMGLPPAVARSCIRFSLGYSTSEQEVDAAAAAVIEAVGMLRD